MSTCKNAVDNSVDDAEVKEFKKEKWFNDLLLMVNLGYFEVREMKLLAKKRKSLENSNKKETKDSAIRLVHFEIDFYSLIVFKSKELGQESSKRGRNHIQMKQAYRVMNLFRRLVFLYQADLMLWFGCFKFCQDINFTDIFSRMLSRFVTAHGHVPEHWVFAAHWELENSKAVDVARQYLDRGIKVLPESRLLHTMAFYLELLALQSAGVVVPQTEGDEEVESEESEVTKIIKEGSLLKAAYTKAGDLCHDVEMKAQMYALSRSFFHVTKMYKYIFAEMVEKHLEDEVTWDLVAQHTIFTSTMPKAIVLMLNNNSSGMKKEEEKKEGEKEEEKKEGEKEEEKEEDEEEEEDDEQLKEEEEEKEEEQEDQEEESRVTSPSASLELRDEPMETCPSSEATLDEDVKFSLMSLTSTVGTSEIDDLPPDCGPCTSSQLPPDEGRVVDGDAVTPSETPSVTPSVAPSETPSVAPSETPSVAPSETPSVAPSETPSVAPSETPSVAPSVAPSETPYVAPSVAPSDAPPKPPPMPPQVAMQAVFCSRCLGGPGSVDLTRRVCRCVEPPKLTFREVGVAGTLMNRPPMLDFTPCPEEFTPTFAGVVVSPSLEQFLALVPYNCPMEQCKKLQGPELPLTDRIDYANSAYELALKKFKNQRIWNYYVGFLKKLLAFESVSQPIRRRIVRDGLLACYTSGFATHDTYKFWFEHTEIMATKESKMIEIMRCLTLDYPTNAEYWRVLVKYLANHDMGKRMRAVFEEAMFALKDTPLNQKRMMVNTMMDYLGLRSKSKMIAFWDKWANGDSELAVYLKPRYIDWLVLNDGIGPTRKVFETPGFQAGITAAILHKMAELELMQPERSLRSARRCHELAATRFGAGNIDVWISYICFEVFYGEDQRIRLLYRRAADALTDVQLLQVMQTMKDIAGID